MTIRDIAVAYNGGSPSKAALFYAAQLARGSGAYVTALIAEATPEGFTFESRYIPAAARAIIEQHNADRMGAILGEFHAAAATLSLGDRLCHEELHGKVDRLLIRRSRLHDLLVMGNETAPGTDYHFIAHPDHIVLKSGKPVIVVPAGYDASAPHRHAIIAWDGRRAVARALSDALDILEAGGKATLLTIGDVDLPRPIEEVQRHLARHDIETDVVRRPVEGRIADTILAHVAEADPALLVMGAYEHSKFRVDLLGGIANQVMARTSVPVLLSH